MNIDIAKTIAALPGTAVLISLLIAAALLVILVNWRLLILALGAQYILIGLMLTRVVPIELAAVKALVGIMICPVLYITARRVNWGRPEEDESEEEPPADRPRRRWWHILGAGWPVRVIVAVLAVAISIGLASRNPLPIVADQSVSRDLTTGAFSVMLLGLINAALSENPLKVGLGLLSLLAGFELFYTAVEPTLTIVGLLGLTNLFLALAISYLTTAWASRRSEVST
ncbi:MAG TPA: hypothetical protein VMP08_25420 [Anaerolineae bacterium]|nr:hypothetical protein [Anaerolineae bacterium]